MPRIQIAELKRITNQLLDHIEKSEVESVEISADYYWHVPKDERYDHYKKPAELSIGQLSDDWMELKKILDGENKPIAFALVWLSNILRYVGEETPV
jgi:hypothetical protein